MKAAHTLRASRTQNMGAEESQCPCNAGRHPRTPQIIMIEKHTPGPQCEGMSHSSKMTYGRQQPSATSCWLWNWNSHAKTLRKINTVSWEWANRRMSRLEPWSEHWSGQVWSCLSSMPLLMWGEGCLAVHGTVHGHLVTYRHAHPVM